MEKIPRCQAVLACKLKEVSAVADTIKYELEDNQQKLKVRLEIISDMAHNYAIDMIYPEWTEPMVGPIDERYTAWLIDNWDYYTLWLMEYYENYLKPTYGNMPMCKAIERLIYYMLWTMEYILRLDDIVNKI